MMVSVGTPSNPNATVLGTFVTDKVTWSNFNGSYFVPPNQVTTPGGISKRHRRGAPGPGARASE